MTIRDRALVAVGASLAFDVLAWVVGIGASADALMDRYETLVCPAAYGHGLWIALQLGFLAYAIAARRHSQRGMTEHDDLARLLVATSLLRPAWAIALHLDMAAAAVLAAFALLGIAVATYARARDLCRREHAHILWTVPFSLFLGWMMIAAIATVSTWLVAVGWRDPGIGETGWTIVSLGAAIVIAVAVGLRFADPIVPLVVTWATVAIWHAHRAENIAVALFSLVGAGTCAVGAGIALLRVVATSDRSHAAARVLSR